MVRIVLILVVIDNRKIDVCQPRANTKILNLSGEWVHTICLRVQRKTNTSMLCENVCDAYLNNLLVLCAIKNY